MTKVLSAIARELGDRGMMSQLHRPFAGSPYNGRARRHVVVGNDNRAAQVERALIAFGSGFAAGCFFTVGLAWVWSWFL